MRIVSSPRFKKALLSAQVLLLLVPLTGWAILFGFVAYAAYPPRDPRPIQIAFDLAALLAAAAIFAAWRLAVAYLRGGAGALRRASAVWFALGAAGALIGLPAAAIAVAHMIQPTHAPDYVGFALLAPAVVLVVLMSHLLWERSSAS